MSTGSLSPCYCKEVKYIEENEMENYSTQKGSHLGQSHFISYHVCILNILICSLIFSRGLREVFERLKDKEYQERRFGILGGQSADPDAVSPGSHKLESK